MSLGELPNLMRALGFYPTQKQIQRMIDEVKISHDGSTGDSDNDDADDTDNSNNNNNSNNSSDNAATSSAPVRNKRETQDINLHDFVRLYVNHRPVFGVSNDDIAEAMALISGSNSRSAKLSWSELKYRLQHEGEKIGDDELQRILNALTGGQPPSEKFTSEDFAADVLGFAADE